MSESFQNVRRIQSTTRANLQTELKTKQLGFDSTTKALGFKNSAGSMSWYTPEAGDATFNSLALTGFTGSTGNLSLNSAGEVVVTNVDIANAVTASTGAIEFIGGITINTDTTKFDVGAVTCYFSDSTDPLAPIVQLKEFPASTANALDNIAGQNATYIAINVSGVITMQGTPFTPTQCRSVIPLGIVIHSNRTSINAINNAVHVVTSPANQISDLMDSIGTFNIDGNIFNYNGANLNINKTSGNIFKNGANFVTDPNDPHTVHLGVLTAPTTLRYRTQLGAETAEDRATIIPGSYDLNGTVTAVGATKWTIQHISVFQSNLVRLQYGQTIYNSLTDAKAAIATDPFVVEQNIGANGLLRGLLIVKGNATDLSDPTQAFFMEVGKFGAVIPIGGGSSSIVSLQNAYDNSTTPEIVSNNTLGALTLANGQTLDTANQLEIKNLAGVTRASINANDNLLLGDQTYVGNYAQLNKYGISVKSPLLASSDIFSLTQNDGVVSNIFRMGSNASKKAEFFFGSVYMTDKGSNVLGLHGPTDILSGLNNYKYLIDGIQHVHENGIAYTGFDNPDNVSISYDYITRKITLSGTSKLYFNGVVVLDLALGNHVSIANPTGTTGKFWYYYGNSGFTWSTSTWQFSDAQIGYVYYSTPWTHCGREVHGCMQWESHRELHETVGTYKISGGTLTAGSYTIGSTTAANRRPGIDATVIADEDLRTSLPVWTKGDYTGKYSTLYVSPINTTNIYVDGLDIVNVIGAIPQVNNVSAGTMTGLAVGEYMNVFLMALPAAADALSQRDRFIFVNGQLASSTRATIDGQTTSSLILGDMDVSSQEYVYLARILIRYIGGDWSIISVNTLSGTKLNQTSSSSTLSTITLPNLVTGGLGLLPVGTAASGHTVFDGSTSAQLSFNSVNGLLSYNSAPECFTAFKPIWSPGVGVSQVGIGFAMYNAAYSTKFNYAGVYGEIVDNTIGSEDGTIVFKAAQGGVLTEQFRAAKGRLGIGALADITPAFDLHILKADNTQYGISLKVENITNDTLGYSYIETKAGVGSHISTAAYCDIMSFSPLWANPDSNANIPGSSHIRATGTGGLSISTATPTGIMRFYVGGVLAGDEAMRITPAARVGMGCDPSVDLHVEKSRNGIVEIRSSNLTSDTDASAIVRAKAGLVNLLLESYSPGYTATTTGGSRPNSGLLYCNGTAGLAITGTGGIRMYSGGNDDADLSLSFVAKNATFGGKVTVTASTNAPGLNIGAVLGATPTGRVTGDVWLNGSYLAYRSGSADFNCAVLSGINQTFTATNTFNYSGSAVVISGALGFLTGKGHRRGLVTKTAAYTLTTGDDVVSCTAATTGYNITLPSTIVAGMMYTIIKSDNNANAITVVTGTPASQTINGAVGGTHVLSAGWTSVTLVAVTTGGWQKIATT